MSIATNLQKLETDITNAYNTISTKGGTIPSDKNTNNLATAINSISGGGSATLITKSITQNGTYNASSDNADGYSKVTVNVSGGEVVEAKSNNVNFYDYDGTRVYSYTKAEFLELQSMPENPTHTGLISQGWNWSLQDAKEYVNDYGKLDIGQMYVTDDGKTRIYVTLEEGRLEPYLSFAINGTAIIDWGDNSTDTITGTSTTTRINTLHEYTTAGDYVITIESEKPIYFIGEGTGTTILWRNATSSGAFPNDVYRQAIKKIELGSNVTSTSIGNYAFSKARSLKSITIPYGITTIKDYAFNYCRNLNVIIIPSGVTSIGTDFCHNSEINYVLLPNGITKINDYCFSNNLNLRRLIIPSSVTSIGKQSIESCQALSNIIIPSGVTSILAQAFQNCYGIKFLDCTKCLQIPTLGSYAFNQTPSDFRIIVPDDLYEAWIAASGWSSYSSKIIKESEWNNS